MSAPASLPGRLLVDLPNWVGDVVMALPAVSRLTAANRGGQTVLHCRPPVARLLAGVYPEARVVASGRRSFPPFTALGLLRGGGRYDLAVTLRNATRAKLLVRIAGRRALGSRGAGSRLLLNDAYAVDRERHQTLDHDALLATLGLRPVDPDWRPQVPPELVGEGRERLQRAGRDGRGLVGIAPSAGWGESKRWPAARFGELGRMLRARGLEPVILVGPGESVVAAEVVAAGGDPAPVVLGEDLDVAALLGVVTGLEVLVGNDSGPMHLADLAGVPVVALFGPTDPARTAPRVGGRRLIRRHLECAPCFEPVCPLGHHRCLAEIEAAEVAEAVLGIVESGNGARDAVSAVALP